MDHRSSSIKSESAWDPRAKIICVGAGRDGTVSLYHMIQDVFDRTGGRRVMHEYCAREFYQAFSEYQETRNNSYAEEIRQMVVECPSDCIVGNGYAAVLPFFREQWGPDTKLIHLRRRDRDACIASLVKNCEMFPLAYGYYSMSEQATIKRMAAFHFGEMTKDEWDRMPTVDKFGWYYDKTHAFIERYKELFAESVDIFTEDLSEDGTRRTIAQLASGDDGILPPRAHLNAQHFDVTALPEEHRDKAVWLIGQLNWELLLNDDAYAVEYFTNRFIAWAGYQIRDAKQLGRSRRPSPAATAETLARTRTLLIKATNEIDALYELNRERAATTSLALPRKS